MISAVSCTVSPLPASQRRDLLAPSGKMLRAGAVTWFSAAVIGQLMFVLYIAVFYWGHALRGNMPAWNKVLQNGHIAGDTTGNIVLAIHVLIAAFITVSGVFQLIPAMRARFPRLHKWNGRIYLTAVVVASVTGLLSVWMRPATGSILQQMNISVNAVLILIAAWFALRCAMKRQMAQHRRWALRLFLVVSGSWFFRVILMFWIAVNRGPVGFDPVTFVGPALVTIGALQYALPLAVLELYFMANKSSSRSMRFGTAALLFVLTAAMALGIAVATMGMWLPNMR